MKKKLFLASLSLNALGLSAQEVDAIATRNELYLNCFIVCLALILAFDVYCIIKRAKTNKFVQRLAYVLSAAAIFTAFFLAYSELLSGIKSTICLILVMLLTIFFLRISRWN